MPVAVKLAVLAALCVAAAYTDLRTGTVPNRLSVPALACGLLLSVLLGGAAGLTSSLLGAGLGFCILLIPFFLHMVGGGDVKFLAAAGAVLGWRLLLPGFLAGATAGALAGLILLFTADRSLTRIRRALVLIHAGMWHRKDGSSGLAAWPGDVRLPYALPLSVGLVTVTMVRLFA